MSDVSLVFLHFFMKVEISAPYLSVDGLNVCRDDCTMSVC